MDVWTATVAAWIVLRVRSPGGSSLSHVSLRRQSSNPIMTTFDPDPPEAVSDDVVEHLEVSSDVELRAIIDYAQRLLRDETSVTEEIEPREGETLVRTEDHGDYVVAIVERADDADGAGGRYAYRIKWQPEVDDEGGTYRWEYFGQVADASGGD